jgi:hypothetical protein
MDRAKYEKLPHDGRNRIEKTPQQDNNTITILSTIPHRRRETIYMNYLYTHQINKAYVKMIEISSSK